MVYRKIGKRILDLTLSLFALLLLSPIFLLCALTLTLANKGTPFFYQLRAGRNGRIFRVVKFKTMSDTKDPSGLLLPDAERLTRVGGLIRKASFDELPQLWNILRGEMSTVGPRPLLPEYLPHYPPRYARRHEVHPGITGWAQVHGRNELKFSQRFEFDVEYVDRYSFSMDVKILCLTVARLLKPSSVIHGQTVDDVDDVGVSVHLSPNNFRKNYQPLSR